METFLLRLYPHFVIVIVLTPPSRGNTLAKLIRGSKWSLRSWRGGAPRKISGKTSCLQEWWED
jgi:hypothetical protein